jgi:hypothetical protein
VESTRPGRSRWNSASDRDSRTVTKSRATQIAATGTLIRKTDPHQKCSSSTPPRIGPKATDRPPSAAQMPMARPWSFSGIAFLMMARVAGGTTAPPMPMTDRHRMSDSGELAQAAKPEATAKITKPTASVRRRPQRSAITPAVNINDAYTRM